MGQFSSESAVKKSSQQISTVVEGETVVLQTNSGMYFSLNEVGALVWKKLDEPCSVNDLCEVILGEYEVSEEQCREDIERLLDELSQAKLIERG